MSLDLFKSFSTSKLVFLLISITACVTFALGRLDSKDFMVLATAAFAFYFSYKGEKVNAPIDPNDTNAEVGSK